MKGFAANLGLLWADLALEDRLRAAAKAGFRAVEFHWPYDTRASSVGLLAEDLGLELLGINTEPGDFAAGERGLGAVPGRSDRFRAGFDRALDYCAASGASAIHIMAGVVAPDDRPVARDIFLGNLAWAAEQAAGSPVKLLIEPLNAIDNPGYFLTEIEAAGAIIDDLDTGAVRLQFDTYHAARQGHAIDRALDLARPHIGHVQIASAPDRGSPDHGEVDHHAFLRLLSAIKYDGWVAAEYVPSGPTEATLDWLEGMQALQHCGERS